MPHPASHRLTRPRHTSSTPQREQQGGPKPSVLPSATMPCPAPPAPNLTEPIPTAPRLIYSPKRAAGSLLRSSVLPSAAIATPRPATPRRVEPSPAMSALSREQQGEPRPSLLPSATIALPCLNPPYRTLPEHTTTGQAGPHWGLHQRMPSMIRLLRQASG
jgi:hypothetical protein